MLIVVASTGCPTTVLGSTCYCMPLSDLWGGDLADATSDTDSTEVEQTRKVRDVFALAFILFGFVDSAVTYDFHIISKQVLITIKLYCKHKNH